MDLKAGFPLFYFAKGTPPVHVGCEPGSDVGWQLLSSKDSDSTSTDPPSTIVTSSNNSSSSSSRKISRQDTQLASLIHRVDGYFKERAEDRKNRIDGESMVRRYGAATTNSSITDLYFQSMEATDRLERFKQSVQYLSPRKRKRIVKLAENEVKNAHARMLAEGPLLDDDDDDHDHDDS